MSYVYILSIHDDDGAEEVTATLDRTRLLEMADHYANLVDKLDEAKIRLADHLRRSDEELAANLGGWDCSPGWGGVQLHVVKLQ